MAVGDIWYNKFNFSTNNRAWSFGLWFEETTGFSPTDSGQPIARALYAKFQASLLGIINVESKFESIQSWRRHSGTAIPGYLKVQSGDGGRGGNAMPNDNALVINLQQEAADAKHNGRIALAGQSDGDHEANDFTNTYLTTQVKTFTDLVPTTVSAVGPDTGDGRIVILSKTFVPAATPIGTCLDVTNAQANTRVLTQRRRKQKACGYVNLIG